MLTPNIIFDYVWLHFCSLYPEAEKLEVLYGSNGQGKLKISAGGFPFFAQKVPFPEQLSWIEFEGTRLPVLFQEPALPLLSENDDQLEIHADLIASAFYFLSGWQEFYSKERDRFNRFPFQASLQYKHQFVTVPVVNYYFGILKTALEKAYGISLKKYENAPTGFTTFLSHDVDRLESAWKVEGLKQAQKGNYFRTAQLVIQKALEQDHWHNLKTVAGTVKKYGATSTFFWLAQPGKYNGHPNADYDIRHPKYQKLIKELAAAGFENSVHGSFGSSENSDQLKAEAAKLNPSVKGNRFHYLCFDPEKTPQALTSADLHYDSTLGFAEHFGFRNAYCFPFRLFDFINLKPYPFLEIPLHLMDATLWHPNYMQILPEQVLETIRPMLQEIQKFGGVFGLLWHNENFSELNIHNGLTVFESIMQELNQMGTIFKTGAAICQTYAERLPEKD
ncbi:polysaccharide deacetylase family protein [Adhaeribacter soli]|uniref:DUF7033 domain-containing protein n=1 Tax=Adhaeribacter soli TaxID=2607655 RepID=A0A5N1J507_9BACT|nr:polysaccharide deacetylase family protein [Adhaeribacter soli]KAA9345807.1 hypothetical protein F0P94_01605 [Adhaeribacter soli]